MKRLWVTGYRSYELSIFSDKDPKLTVIKYTLTNYFKSLLEEGKIVKQHIRYSFSVDLCQRMCFCGHIRIGTQLREHVPGHTEWVLFP